LREGARLATRQGQAYRVGEGDDEDEDEDVEDGLDRGHRRQQQRLPRFALHFAFVYYGDIRLWPSYTKVYSVIYD